MIVHVIYPDCGHSVPWQQSRRIPDSCPDCENNIQSNGMCEDYPCCGHMPGECGFRPEFTSDYWHERFASMSQEEMEWRDQTGEW